MAGVTIIIAGAFWFGRDTTSSSAPVDTSLVIHFSPNRLSWNATQQALGSITLVSNRSLRASDLRGFAAGDFSLFIGFDGTRSVAVHVPSDHLPINMLDSLGILVEKTANDVYLLSDRPMARMEWKPRHVWFGSIHWPGNQHLGSFYTLGEDSMQGSMYGSNDKIFFRTPKRQIARLPKGWMPSNTILAMATPFLTNIDMTSVTSAMDPILSPFGGLSVSGLADVLRDHQSMMLVTKSDKTSSFLLSIDSNVFDKERQQKILQTISALLDPHSRNFSLPDNSIASEIVVDPSLISIEETTISGLLVSRTAIKSGSYLYGVERDVHYILTDSEELLTNTINGSKARTLKNCMGNSAFLDLREILALSAETKNSRVGGYLEEINQEYETIGIQQGTLYTTIQACR